MSVKPMVVLSVNETGLNLISQITFHPFTNFPETRTVLIEHSVLNLYLILAIYAKVRMKRKKREKKKKK